jgi:phosphatidylserine decarboxylase
MSIAREGWAFIFGLLVLGLVLVVLRFPIAGGVVIALGVFVAFFFRDPEREVPRDPRLVLSPADGKVVVVAPAPEGNPLGQGAHQVSIFLSVFDVHINRSPIGGRVAQVAYQKGGFRAAWDPRASLENEQNLVLVEDGPRGVAFKQIAGLIARRIVFHKKAGDAVAAGERVGMIKFGSRVDVFMPGEARVLVSEGDRVAGGVSVLGELAPPPGSRAGA